MFVIDNSKDNTYPIFLTKTCFLLIAEIIQRIIHFQFSWSNAITVDIGLPPGWVSQSPWLDFIIGIFTLKFSTRHPFKYRDLIFKYSFSLSSFQHKVLLKHSLSKFTFSSSNFQQDAIQILTNNKHLNIAIVKFSLFSEVLNFELWDIMNLQTFSFDIIVNVTSSM